ncbi:tetratricopeptide repeat protein [Pontibacter sp. G13]|uniref:tetratricopeptide repeat protein n=1 Tax=Pontibacter sp. G13 TaxID=3074898 RepID=UPI002889C586|nr:tetratricopeptide repeat protein [Pontibacter sp. G13]WNJ20903.1 tetratricopeptide repeat protein [Pontibacter sp. G13]
MNLRILFHTFIWVALLAIPMIGQAQGPGKRAYLAAENFRKQGKCQDAITQYHDAIRLEPNNYKYYFQRGKCEYKLRDMDAAKESFKATIDYQKNFTPAYALLAKIYKDGGDYTNAIYYYEEAAKYEQQKGRKVQYKLLLVNLLLKEERSYDAKRHIREAKTIDATNPNVLFYEGEIALEDRQWRQAEDSYTKALSSERLKSANPAEKAKYFYGLGLAKSNLGDAAGAKKAWANANFGPYKKLIAQEMMKNNHVYYYRIAVSYYLNGEYKLAQQHIQKTLELQNNFGSAFILQGKIAQKQGNTSGAINHYKKAISAEQDASKRSKMYYMVAKLQIDNNDAYGALSSLNEAFSGDPKAAANTRLLYLKAKAEYNSRKYNDAVATLDKLMQAKLDTKSKAKYSFMLGMAAKATSDNERAREAFKNAMYGPYKPAAQMELEKLKGNG